MIRRVLLTHVGKQPFDDKVRVQRSCCGQVEDAELSYCLLLGLLREQETGNGWTADRTAVRGLVQAVQLGSAV